MRRKNKDEEEKLSSVKDNRLMNELYDFWLAERLLECRKDVSKIVKQFDNAQQVYETDFEDGTNRYGISERAIELLNNKNLNNASVARIACQKGGISWVTIYSEGYPKLLKDIECPPYMLFIKGDASLLVSRACIGVVGTRRMSVCGKYSAFKMSYELSKAGLVIVSGMALGIDSMSHAGAIAARGKTIAVLGSGPDVIYPKEHTKVYNEIIRQGGAVISEYFPGKKPTQNTFPTRNRIISGMCRATVVVEAPRGSGALITATDTIREGRTVFAMPGYAYSVAAEGTNDLIRGGAIPVTDSSAILAEYSGIEKVKYRFDPKSMECATVALCDQTVRDLQISTRAYEAYMLGPQLPPEEIMRSHENENEDFPFKVRQLLSKTAKAKSVKKKGDMKEDTLPEKAPRQSAAVMISACEQIGFELSDGMKKVCECIASRDTVTVEELHRDGCVVSDVLQTLSLLTQTGILCEYAPGNFKF